MKNFTLQFISSSAGVIPLSLICCTTVPAQNYTLYGITQYGGTYNHGTIFKYSYPSGNFTVIHNFNDTNGAHPRAYLMQANDGKIYGTTSEGGSSGLGVLYSIDPNTSMQTVLVNFNGSNGASPEAGLIQTRSGLLYGSATAGGTYNYGDLYSYDIITHIQTVLFSFSDTNGNSPSAHVVEDSHGFIYGHTLKGGTYNDGVLFSYNINTNTENTVFTFNGFNGTTPRGLTLATNGLLYGCAFKGGSSSDGILYSFDPTTVIQTVLVNFSGANGLYGGGVDAGDPFQASNGLLYSSALQGGVNNNGILFSYDINTNSQNIFLNFSTNGLQGRNPNGNGYTQTPDGLLYIPVDSGGANGYGCLLCINTITNTWQDIYDFTLTDGTCPLTNLLCIQNRICHASLPTDESIAVHDIASGIYDISVSKMNGNCNLIIYNLTGQKIGQKTLVNPNTQFSIAGQPKGIYLYQVLDMNGNLLSSGKLIGE